MSLLLPQTGEQPTEGYAQMTTKADLYRLIDALPEELGDAAARRLEDLQRPEQLAQTLK